MAPVKMTKSGPDVSGGPNAPLGQEIVYTYFPGDYIKQNIHPQFEKIVARDFLVDMAFDDFVPELAEHWAEINTGAGHI